MSSVSDTGGVHSKYASYPACDIHSTDEEARCSLTASSIPASRAEAAAQISNFAGMQLTKTQYCLSHDTYRLLNEA